ncbi:hypothetical protein SDC9_173951 [bioreactor metagenome]|uniref:Uncharacterized protein n=1 Tax=bioreactor metagenome TaxID=1076179 RepID=A0A645GJW3_9ZZZZ
MGGRADAHLARRRRRHPAPGQHDPRRRWRRHHAGAQGRAVREGGRGAAGGRGPRLRRVPGLPGAAARIPRTGRQEVDRDRRVDSRRHRGDHHRRAAVVPALGRRRSGVPRDQRQRLGHQEQVRQYLRLPPQPDRRNQARARRDALRQDGHGLRIRRRRQRVRRGAAQRTRPGDGQRDRPDLRASGLHGGFPGLHGRGCAPLCRPLRHHHRQLPDHHRRTHVEDEGPGDRLQHRPLR